MQAVFIGGGIAGLAAAVALGQRGWEVTVLEAVDSFAEVGAGFGLTPNGLTALEAIGLGEQARQDAWPLTMGGMQDYNGKRITRYDAGAPYADQLRTHGMKRQPLHAHLVAAAADHYVVHSARVLSLTEGEPLGELAEVKYEVDGQTRSIRAHLVVGADGIRSFTRTVVAPETKVRYSGMTSWRGIADDEDETDHTFSMVWGPAAEFGAVRTSAAEVYWYGYVKMARGTTVIDEKAAALDRFAAWRPEVTAYIEQTPSDRVMRHDVYTLKKPASTFVRGRIALVGDAAHAMLPTLGQGVNTALEDSVTLAALVGGDDEHLGEALSEYHRVRHARTSRIHAMSVWAAQFGSHLSLGAGRFLRRKLLRLVPLAASAKASSSRFAWSVPESPHRGSK